MLSKNDDNFTSYWLWFFKGSGGLPGYRRLLNSWLIFHIIVGFIISEIVKIDLAIAANTVLIPFIGIFIGLSFAWAGNAHAIMRSSELDDVANYHEGGFVEYVFVYQTAILSILITLVLWGFAGLFVYDKVWPKPECSNIYFIVKIILYSFASLTLRECWQVVMGAQWMLLIQRKVRHLRKKTDFSDD